MGIGHESKRWNAHVASHVVSDGKHIGKKNVTLRKNRMQRRLVVDRGGRWRSPHDTGRSTPHLNVTFTRHHLSRDRAEWG
jgi:hypothetical protein